MDSIIADFNDVFGDTAHLKPMAGSEMHIHLQDERNIKPRKILTARQIPLHWQDEAEEVIKAALSNGIITPVTDPTDWISPAFFVPKEGGKGGLRLVTDYTELNKHVRRPVHLFPSNLELIRSIKPDSKFFAKLDAVQGYFQIPLDDESSRLTTFLLPSGRYAYRRAPMGLNASSDEWCRRSDAAIVGLPGTLKLVDDILVQASSESELYQRIRAVLQRCREHCITISKRKLSTGSIVKFAGYLITANGVQPDPEKLQAIRQFPVPIDLFTLRSFLGLANQLGAFIPDLAHMTGKLRHLLKKDVAYVWLPEHQEEFETVRKMLTSEMIVHHFDPKLQTELLADASRLKVSVLSCCREK